MPSTPLLKLLFRNMGNEMIIFALRQRIVIAMRRIHYHQMELLLNIDDILNHYFEYVVNYYKKSKQPIFALSINNN